MDGAAIDGQRGFLDRFIQRRMTMTGARNIFGRSTKGHGGGTFMNDGAGFMADDMHTKHTVRLGIGEDLHKSIGMTLGTRTAVCREREASLLEGNPCLFQSLLE